MTQSQGRRRRANTRRRLFLLFTHLNSSTISSNFMTLHLHFLETASQGRPRLAMTQCWPTDDAVEPATATFGTFDIKLTQNHFPKADPTAFCQLILRGQAIEGDLAKTLWEVARKPEATWLRSVFGMNSGQPFPKELINHAKEQCDLGANLKAATIECFLHPTVALAQGAHRPPTKSPGSGPGARSRTRPLQPLDAVQRRRLADRMLGDVRITELKILVMKNTVGQWRESTERGLLPLTAKDIFQLKVTCDKEAHLYVVWIGSSGDSVQPIFPWLPTLDWDHEEARRRDIPRKELVLTKDYLDELPARNRQLRSCGQPGAETLLVLAHVSPLKMEDLKRHLERMPAGIHGPIPYRVEGELEVLDWETGVPATVANYGLVEGPADDALTAVGAWVGRLPMRVHCAKGLVIPSLGG
jgi:hypothetical protein